jgi:cyclophilin family peptidyl-prolyl cis-trans isomerase
MSVWFERILFIILIVGFGLIIYTYQSKFAWWSKQKNIKLLPDEVAKKELIKIQQEQQPKTQQTSLSTELTDTNDSVMQGLFSETNTVQEDDLFDTPTEPLRPTHKQAQTYQGQTLINPLHDKNKRRLVMFNIGVNGEYVGRVVFQLYDDIVPKTCENFIQLAKSKYAGTMFHRISPGFCIQGGDFINGDGTGSMSIYGATFEDENFNIRHDRAGVLSMANTEMPNTNGSQFFITLAPASFLDGKHVAFGQVVEGLELIQQIGTIPVDQNETPTQPVHIMSCNEIFE